MIKAKLHTDDLVYNVELDATAWFEKASSEILVKLIMCNFTGRPAEGVALFFEHYYIFEPNGDIGVAFEYCRTTRIGFKCVVNAGDAKKWISDNIKHLSTKEKKEHNGKCYFSTMLSDMNDRLKNE